MQIDALEDGMDQGPELASVGTAACFWRRGVGAVGLVDFVEFVINRLTGKRLLRFDWRDRRE
jgi:hypothetical protein